MTKYVLKRIGMALLTLLIIVFLLFFLVLFFFQFFQIGSNLCAALFNITA